MTLLQKTVHPLKVNTISLL